ncbi:MAG: hypothetical protein ACREID_02650 [Planctomycetota bacterium]
MKLDCGGCGATLKVNPNLGGAALACPKCGAEVRVPAGARGSPRAAVPAARRPARYTIALLLAQALLLALAGSCLAGALFREALSPPAWSYLHESPILLAAAGATLFLLAIGARRLPVLSTLAAALLVMWGCALHFRSDAEVDASRTLALSASLAAVWLALQHRRG